MCVFCFLICVACDDDSGDTGDGYLRSDHTSSESHRTGENCAECHAGGGSGGYVFTVSGSVYQLDLTTPYPQTTVDLMSGVNGSGERLLTLEVDRKGNFYTTEPIDLGAGVYAIVYSPTGTQFKQQPVSVGACNSCHGVSSARIYVN